MSKTRAIACPKCHKYNKPFANRCTECGVSLSGIVTEVIEVGTDYKEVIKETPKESKKTTKQTTICPSCGAINKARAFRCMECQSRLVNLVETKPITGPTSLTLKDTLEHTITITKEQPLTLGREQLSSLKQAQYISRKHVTITLTDEGIQLEDLHSTNGTWVDGEPLRPHEPVVVEHFNHLKLASTMLVRVSNED
jgi:hypothetical protein